MARRRSEPLDGLLGLEDPVLSHHPMSGGPRASVAETHDRYGFDAKAFGEFVADALGVVDDVWTIAKATEFLTARGVSVSAWHLSARSEVIVIEREALVRLSPRALAVLRSRTEIRMVSVSLVVKGHRPKLRGAPPVLNLAIAVAQNVDSLLEDEIAEFISGTGVDTGIGAASSAVTGLGIQISAIALGGGVLLPLTIGVVLGVVVHEAATHQSDEYRVKRRLAALLRDVAAEAEKNAKENARELDRGRLMLQRAQSDPRAAFQLMRAVFGGY